jgi:hypothetical protein
VSYRLATTRTLIWDRLKSNLMEKEGASQLYTIMLSTGNKILANTAKMSFFGKPRLHRTRLTVTANFNNNSIYVEAGLTWEAGKRICLAPSAFREHEIDFAIISSYDNSTGQILLDRTLNYYRWGAPNSMGP